MLLLFDIDGTLMRGGTEAHRQALRRALLAVHRVDAPLDVGAAPLAGRTDGEIARVALLGAGVSAERIDSCAGAVREACGRAYARLAPQDLSGAVVPGMPPLLEWLSRRCRLGLLTGNYEAVARLKLARAGIGRFFPAHQGAFGSDGEDRAALPAIARRRAGSPGRPYPRELTIVIGDTPRDIACARADGVGAVAVAFGPYGADELREADAVAADVEALGAELAKRLAGAGTARASSGPTPGRASGAAGRSSGGRSA